MLIMQIMFPEKEDNVEYAFKLAKSHDLVTTKASKSGLKKNPWVGSLWFCPSYIDCQQMTDI